MASLKRGGALLGAVVLTVTGCAGNPSKALPGPSQDGPRSSLPSMSGPPVGSADAPSAADLRAGYEWEGEFTIAIEVWDYCTSFPDLARSDSYTMTESFSFSTAAPVDYGPAARETNPFFISAGTDPDQGGPVGLALQSTGVIALPGQESDPYVLQYWTLSYDDGRLTGVLTEDGREMGLAFNGFQDNDNLIPCQPAQGVIVRPYPMQEGATITAEISEDLASVVIEGRSHDEARRWRVEGTAKRVS